MHAILARDLVKEYRLGKVVVRALDGADLDVQRGRFVAILGKSGSGKSTLVNLVGGLDQPTSGKVEVEGHRLDRLGRSALAAFRAQTVGFVFQSFHLQPRYLAWENVGMPLVFAGVRRQERRRRASALLERVGLAHRSRHRPTELSGGEQQRVALARSLIADPQILLADEPTGNLDSHTSAQVMELLREANEQGTTVVVVTHDHELAATYATQIVRMEDGRVVASEESAA